MRENKDIKNRNENRKGGKQKMIATESILIILGGIGVIGVFTMLCVAIYKISQKAPNKKIVKKTEQQILFTERDRAIINLIADLAELLKKVK